MDFREPTPMATAVIYRENGVAKIYVVPKPLPFDELIRRFEHDRAAEQAKGTKGANDD